MTITEIKETFTNKRGETLETIKYQIDAQDGYYLSKDGYSYGNSVITDDTNGWTEHLIKEE